MAHNTPIRFDDATFAAIQRLFDQGAPTEASKRKRYTRFDVILALHDKIELLLDQGHSFEGIAEYLGKLEVVIALGTLKAYIGRARRQAGQPRKTRVARHREPGENGSGLERRRPARPRRTPPPSASPSPPKPEETAPTASEMATAAVSRAVARGIAQRTPAETPRAEAPRTPKQEEPAETSSPTAVIASDASGNAPADVGAPRASSAATVATRSAPPTAIRGVPPARGTAAERAPDAPASAAVSIDAPVVEATSRSARSRSSTAPVIPLVTLERAPDYARPASDDSVATSGSFPIGKRVRAADL